MSGRRESSVGIDDVLVEDEAPIWADVVYLTRAANSFWAEVGLAYASKTALSTSRSLVAHRLRKRFIAFVLEGRNNPKAPVRGNDALDPDDMCRQWMQLALNRLELELDTGGLLAGEKPPDGALIVDLTDRIAEYADAGVRRILDLPDDVADLMREADREANERDRARRAS